MPGDSVDHSWDVSVIHIPAGRCRALTRAGLWLMAGLLLGAVAFVLYGNLDFRPSGGSSRLVGYSVALVALPIPIAGAVAVVKGVRWFLLGCWPAPVGAFAGADALLLRLGSFGTRRYDAARLEVRYPFELPAEAEGGGFEAFLPEEQQRDTLLPRITHPDAGEPLNWTILRFARVSEAEAARTLRPLLDRWRTAPQTRS